MSFALPGSVGVPRQCFPVLSLIPACAWVKHRKDEGCGKGGSGIRLCEKVTQGHREKGVVSCRYYLVIKDDICMKCYGWMDRPKKLQYILFFNHFIFYCIFFYYHLSPLYLLSPPPNPFPAPPHKHHTDVYVHEFFSFFAQSLHPPRAVSLLYVSSVHSVHSTLVKSYGICLSPIGLFHLA